MSRYSFAVRCDGFASTIRFCRITETSDDRAMVAHGDTFARNNCVTGSIEIVEDLTEAGFRAVSRISYRNGVRSEAFRAPEGHNAPPVLRPSTYLRRSDLRAIEECLDYGGTDAQRILAIERVVNDAIKRKIREQTQS